MGEVAERLGPSPRLIALEAAPEPASIAAYLAARRAGQPVLLLAPGADTSTRRLVDAYDPDVVIGANTNWGPDVRRRRSSHVLHPDLALLVSTSGSTGSPKVVRLSAASVQANAESIAAYLQLTPEDRAITSLPLHYCYGLSVLNSHLAVGASITLSGLSVVDPCFWELFRTSGVTSLAGVPYTFELLDRVGFDSMRLPSLRLVTQAGGRLPAEAVRRFAELGRRDGWELFVMYGQTEATARMAYLPPEFAVSHPHAIGVPIAGGELDIDPVREDPDHGELVYRGPNVLLGYATGPADLANRRVVHELRTGDLARRAPDGIFEITGRRSRFIKPFGVRVDLDHLKAHLGEAGVTALCAGDDSGIAAAVTSVAQRDVAAPLIVDHTRLPLRCVAVAVVQELPRLPNGKPDHTAVLAAAERSIPSPPPTGDTLAERLVSAYTAVLGGPVSAEDSFVSAGGDSFLRRAVRAPRGDPWDPPAGMAPAADPRPARPRPGHRDGCTAGIGLCSERADHGTRELLEEILEGEEEHADWLETQLALVEQIGEAHYLAQHIHD